MINKFKFFDQSLVYSHEGHPIYAGELFYSVAKHDYDVTYRNGVNKTVPKYNMATRFVYKEHRDKFRPDHERLWYFKSKSNAEWLIEHWKRQDDGILFYNTSDITLTFSR